MTIEKIKFLGALLELPAKRPCQFGGKWAGLAVLFIWYVQKVSKDSIYLEAEYLSDVKSIAT